MGVKGYAAEAINQVLRPLGAKISPCDAWQKPWDQEFAEWMARAKRTGLDPNDIGDAEWASDPLRYSLEQYCLPHVDAGSTVLELGPGTGRLTRHLIGRCQDMVLVDYSRLGCEWLKRYLEGKGRFRVIHIETPQFDDVAEASIDIVVANGVFEHLDMDDVFYFLLEFRRVMRPGAYASFNFNNAATDESMALFRTFRGGVGSKCIFKFHHPSTISRIAEEAGLEVLRVSTSQSRFAQMEIRAPLQGH